MKRLLFGFAIGIVVSPYIRSTQAQSSIRISGTMSPELVTLGQEPPAAAHAPHELSVRDAIEILADYDIKHVEQQPFFQPAYGVTNFDSNPPAVWIFNVGDTPSRRSTVIHELLHVYYHQRGTDLTEEFIRSEEDRQYKTLFGDGQ